MIIFHETVLYLLGLAERELQKPDKSLFYTYNINMDRIKFEWNNNKARINIEKYGITFEEASTVFADENAILFDDPEHSEDEKRFFFWE